jgi:hypothetical protein
MIKRSLSLLFYFLTFAAALCAQPKESPVDYMSNLSSREELLGAKYLSYMSEVAHGHRARKMEKRRTELINTIQETIREGGKLRPYAGDVSLRNAFLEYWNILLLIFKEDYHKIVDMEEVAEQSYDKMEAYLLAQEKVDEKLKEAYAKVPLAYAAFAAKHNVTLTEGEQSKVSQKLNQVGKVNHYITKLFLIYFKSSVQESNLANALQSKDINAVEQTRNAMLKYSKEGLTRLDTLKPYNGDGSLITACRKVLEFHQLEAEKKIPLLSDFLIKSDEFDHLRKSIEAKPAAQRTQTDVDTYNKAVNDFNKEVQVYNKNSTDLHNGSNKVLANWDQSKKRFMDMHTPYK